MLWATPKGPPRALQASECRELLNPTRASCLILAQRQPGKLSDAQTRHVSSQVAHNTGVEAVNPPLRLGSDPAKNWLLFALARPYHGNL